MKTHQFVAALLMGSLVFTTAALAKDGKDGKGGGGGGGERGGREQGGNRGNDGGNRGGGNKGGGNQNFGGGGAQGGGGAKSFRSGSSQQEGKQFQSKPNFDAKPRVNSDFKPKGNFEQNTRSFSKDAGRDLPQKQTFSGQNPVGKKQSNPYINNDPRRSDRDFTKDNNKNDNRQNFSKDDKRDDNRQNFSKDYKRDDKHQNFSKDFKQQNRNLTGAESRSDFDKAKRNTTYYRGNPRTDFNRNSSKFFSNNAPYGGNRGQFNGKWNNYAGYGGYGRRYGGYSGYGGYGLGYGYGVYGGLGFLPLLLGYGYGPGYSNAYGPGVYGNGFANDYDYNYPVVTGSVATAPPMPAPTNSGIDYVTQGENNFRAGRYSDALNDFRHALIDEPSNAGAVMLLAQTLFQTGEFTPAAGATEMAMGVLPEDQWGAVVQNYKQLYGNYQDYTDQIKALERARDQNANDPALRFLLGFHFGYLGYPKQAVRELNQAVELEPRDPAARRLHDLFAQKIGAPMVGPAQEVEGAQVENPQPGEGEAPAPAGTEQ
jgi:tetratricopeptide (TPR) repeat protein